MKVLATLALIVMCSGCGLGHIFAFGVGVGVGREMSKDGGGGVATKPSEVGYRYANDRPDVPYTYNQYGYCKTYIK